MKTQTKIVSGILALILTAAVIADNVARFRYLYIGSTANIGRHGSVASNDVVTVTEDESAYLTDRTKWLPIDKTLSDNPLILSGGAATLSAYPQIYMLNVTTSIVVLPTAVGKYGQQYTIKMWNVNTGTVATTSSQKIDGATTYEIGPSNAFIRVISDNAAWWIVSKSP